MNAQSTVRVHRGVPWIGGRLERLPIGSSGNPKLRIVELVMKLKINLVLNSGEGESGISDAEHEPLAAHQE